MSNRNKETDYYAVLNIKRDVTQEQITLAYRKLALILCPYRQPYHERDYMPDGGTTHMAPLSAARQWDYINMAYDVLSNELRRSIYDRFGEAALFRGTMLPNGFFPPYQYHGDHMKIYHDVFGNYLPYSRVIDAVTNPPVLYSEHGIGTLIKDPPVEKVLFLDLKEVRFGAVKLMHVLRQEFVDESRMRTEKRKITLTLNITPGITAGTRFCFKEEGDRCPSRIPADIIFIAADKPHTIFERRNMHDLLYKREVNLTEAMCGVGFTIETLDKRHLKIAVTDVIHPGYKKVIEGEGLPKCVEQTLTLKRKAAKLEFGDLIIEFTITFPHYLTREMKHCTRYFFQELKRMEYEATEGPSALTRLLPHSPN